MEEKTNNQTNKKIAANIGHSKEENLALTRAAFYDRARKNAEYFGCEQFIDLSDPEQAKLLTGQNFDKTADVFGWMFGHAFKLEKDQFFALMNRLSDFWSEGSGIVFDYPSIQYEGETKVRYGYHEMEQLLSECGFRIYEYLDHKMAEEQLFYKHNLIHPRKQVKPPKGVDYCLAVRK